MLRAVLAVQARAALLTASQCATYDELKLFFVRQLGWEDNLQTHFAGTTALILVLRFRCICAVLKRSMSRD